MAKNNLQQLKNEIKESHGYKTLILAETYEKYGRITKIYLINGYTDWTYHFGKNKNDSDSEWYIIGQYRY